MPREDYYQKRARSHADIRRLLKQLNDPSVSTDHLADALNAINAAGMLAEAQRQFPSTYLCYGPKTVKGDSSVPYLGSVIWYRPAGYYDYEKLTILGIWALHSDQDMRILLGTASLDYVLPFYQPEHYQYELRKDFVKFYGNRVPPPAKPLHTLIYASDKRLEQRLLLEKLVSQWVEGYQSSTSSK